MGTIMSLKEMAMLVLTTGRPQPQWTTRITALAFPYAAYCNTVSQVWHVAGLTWLQSAKMAVVLSGVGRALRGQQEGPSSSRIFEVVSRYPSRQGQNTPSR